MEAAAEKIQMLRDKRRELETFIDSAINDILERRKKDLEGRGVDVNCPDVLAYIEQFKKTKLEAFGKKELDTIDEEIRSLNPGQN